MTEQNCVGTVMSDGDTPTFELVRVKMKAGCDLKPGALVRIPTSRKDGGTLIGRVRAAYEHNPNAQAEAINVRDTLGVKSNYPAEQDSTTIYRRVEAEIIEEIVGEIIRAPQTLPNSDAAVFPAEPSEVVKALGLESDAGMALNVGHIMGGGSTPIRLKREALQRHFFICGTTGSGKSYAMCVLAEEILKHHLPVVFIDTQDEYSAFVQKHGGAVVEPGQDFSIRISALTESEFLNLLPEAMKKSPLQCDIATKAFGELKTTLINEGIAKFTLDDVLARIPDAAKALCAKEGDVPRVTDSTIRRTQRLADHRIFGRGTDVADWRKLMYPCMAINCKRLTSGQLQSVATAVLRELQLVRTKGHIPPYVAVIDEAHLFVPQGEESPCKQIIREGVRIGRHHGICMILLTQSPVDIDKSVIRQCNTRLVFALEPDQLDAIRGVKADASEEMLRALPKMPRGSCLLSGTYESIKHSVPVSIREQSKPEALGGKAPPIFDDMVTTWVPEINKLKGRQ